MGFRWLDDFKTMLRGFYLDQTATASLQYQSSPSWDQAFPDSIRANQAAQGLAQAFRATQFDPQKNWCDFVEGDLTLSGAAQFGPSKDYYFTSGLGIANGDKSIRFNANPTLDGVDTPVFRVTGGRSYRVTVLWEASAVSEGLRFVTLTYKGDLSSGSSYFITPPVSYVTAAAANTRQYDSYVITLAANESFAYCSFGKSTPSSGNTITVHEILVEPEPESFYAALTNATTFASGTTAPVVFNSEQWDYGGQYDNTTGNFTCIRPGIYHFGAKIEVSGMADATQLSVNIQQNGTIVARELLNQSGTASLGPFCSAIVNCSRGDVVRVSVGNTDADAGTETAAISGNINHFWGIRQQ